VPRFLLDTNVVSEIKRPKPAPRVTQWLVEQRKDDLFLAAVSLGELVRGVERLPVGSRRQTLERWITHEIMQDYKGRILAFDKGAAETWGRILGAGDRVGRALPVLDAQIAATAISRSLILATRNIEDYAAMGVKVFDPWMGR
jgi:toxin FitB